MPLLHHVLGGPGHCIDPGLVVVDLSHGGLVLLDQVLHPDKVNGTSLESLFDSVTKEIVKMKESV